MHEIDAAKNEEVFAELIQFLDNKCLAPLMRDAQDDGRKALRSSKHTTLTCYHVRLIIERRATDKNQNSLG